MHSKLQGKIPIIGVAKSNFKTIEKLKRPLLRGDSRNPVFITAIGMHVDIDTENIRQMGGQFRMPTLLKVMDRTTKEI